MAEKSYNVHYPDISNTASAHECTGMMPTPPLTDGEYKAYQELYGMEIPKERKQPEHPKK
nr:hypothetical protein [Maliibacterium massiliense]